jgi:hypothetical protein
MDKDSLGRRSSRDMADPCLQPLRYDDLLEEEREDVSVALKRLSPKEAYERIYRIRRATQCSVQHKLLPRNEWTKPEQVRSSQASAQ